MLRTLTADPAMESVNRGAPRKAQAEVSRRARPVDWPPPPVFETDMDAAASILERRQALDGPDGIRASTVRARWNEDETEDVTAQAVNATLKRVEQTKHVSGVAVWYPEPVVPGPVFLEEVAPGAAGSFRMADTPDGLLRARVPGDGRDASCQPLFETSTEVPVAEIFRKPGTTSADQLGVTQGVASAPSMRSRGHRASYEQQERAQRRLVVVILALLAFGMSTAFVLTTEQRKHAQASLVYADWQHRRDEASLQTTADLQKRMFAQAVAARAALIDRYLDDLEKVLVGYRDEAARLLTLPDVYLPRKSRTPAGRDGFYTEEDYANPALRPPDVYAWPAYQIPVSRSEGVVAFAPFVSTGHARPAASRDAARLARLSTPFSLVFASRDDILWSRVRIRSGVLLRYPGSSQEGVQSRFDPTQSVWYQEAIVAQDEAPRWLAPHLESMSHGLLLPCVCGLRVNGQTVGALGIDVSLLPVREMLKALTDSLGAGARAILARPDGTVLVDTQQAGKESPLNDPLASTTLDEAGREFGAYYDALLSGHAGPQLSVSVRTEGQQKLLTHSNLVHPDWLLIASIDQSAVLAAR